MPQLRFWLTCRMHCNFAAASLQCNWHVCMISCCHADLHCNCRSACHVCALYPNSSINIASCYICTADLYCLLKCVAMQACVIGTGSGMHLQKQGWHVLAAWCCKCCGKPDSSVSSLQGSCAAVDLAWLVPHSQCCRLGLYSLLQGQSTYPVQWYRVSGVLEHQTIPLRVMFDATLCKPPPADAELILAITKDIQVHKHWKAVCSQNTDTTIIMKTFTAVHLLSLIQFVCFRAVWQWLHRC